MSQLNIENIILSKRKEYCKLIQEIPFIKEVCLVSSEYSIAQFKTSELYSENYIIYVNSEIESYPDQYIEQVLFHEFTHMADSSKFLKLEYNEYKNIMQIYSETHASEIEMDRILLTQEINKIGLQYNVIHGGILTLKSFMDQTLKHLENEFISLSEGSGFDAKELYYFTGYLISLKKNDIKYDWEFKTLDKNLSPIFTEIINVLLNNDYNNKILLEYQNRLTCSIKEYIKYDFNKMSNNLFQL